MKRLNCLIPDKLSGISFYRGVRPLTLLSKKHNFFLDFEENISWGSLSVANGVFMQLPVGRGLLKICELAKAMKTPTLLDFDDYLFGIPDWNPAKRIYRHDVLEDLKMTISNSDYVSVTTAFLAEELSKFNSNITIIPNAFDDELFGFEKIQSKNKTIAWRGSATHIEDLKSIIPAIQDIQNSKQFLDWSWYFIGKDAQVMKKQIPSAKIIDQMGLLNYFSYIKELNPAIQIVPLVDHPFNRAKSNIAWLEATYSGAVTVAPEYLEEFNRPGVVRYRDVEHFKQLMIELMQNPESLGEYFNKSYEYIKENLLLSKVNDQRAKLILDKILI